MTVWTSPVPWRLLSSAAASGLFLFATVLYPVWRDRVDETAAIGLQIFALAVFCLSFAVTVTGLWAIGRTRGRSLLPLLPQTIALSVLLLPPVNRVVDLAEFQKMAGWRAEVVALVASGELMPRSSPEQTEQVVQLPEWFPKAVSDAAGQRAVAVVQRDRAFDVVFLPPRGIKARATGYVYRSDDTPPELPSGLLREFAYSERIAPHWYRLTS